MEVAASLTIVALVVITCITSSFKEQANTQPTSYVSVNSHVETIEEINLQNGKQFMRDALAYLKLVLGLVFICHAIFLLWSMKNIDRSLMKKLAVLTFLVSIDMLSGALFWLFEISHEGVAYILLTVHHVVRFSTHFIVTGPPLWQSIKKIYWKSLERQQIPEPTTTTHLNFGRHYLFHDLSLPSSPFIFQNRNEEESPLLKGKKHSSSLQ
eukprot:gb/GECH01004630.1/.p1 GENE.gb/GECH01004630.1/~~gb/GECH01004630.1/.p1  ORF type:complete len:211 (+),score=23.32 gb/GECH01004630.1/:1-633(+)